MSVEHSIQKLKEIAAIFFNKDASYGEQLNACNEYKALALQISELDVSFIDVNEDLKTASGKAIGPANAASCIGDFRRTVKFCNGIYTTIKQLQAKHKGRVHILYAGTGPFATLILPLITQFSPQEIGFTLVEINQKSVACLQRVIDYFDMSNYIIDLYQEDATTLTLTSGNTVDILVVEAMTHALKSEHQVAIVHNLVPQLRKDIVLIPKSIALDLVAIDAEKQHKQKQSLEPIPDDEPYLLHLGTLFMLNKETIDTNAKDVANAFPKYHFPEVFTHIPEDINENYSNLSIATTIKITDDELLDIDESGLTILHQIYALDPMVETGNRLKSKYICGKHPRLQCRLIYN